MTRVPCDPEIARIWRMGGLPDVEVEPSPQNGYRFVSPKINPEQYSLYTDLILKGQIPVGEADMILEANPEFKEFYARRVTARQWLAEAREVSDRVDAMVIPETPGWVTKGLWLFAGAAFAWAALTLAGLLK